MPSVTYLRRHTIPIFRTMTSLVYMIPVLLPVLCGSAPVDWIDMSYPFDNETLHWPTVNSFKHVLDFDNYTAGGFYLYSYDFSGSEHGGTHIDAPRHFAPGKWTIDQIPLDTLIGPAIVVDISNKASKDPDAEMLPGDLEDWEEKHGRIPDGVILLVYSGWGKYWPDKKKYMGTETKNTSILHFPGINPNASRWLVNNRKVKMVGIDSLSLDHGQSKTNYQTHQILFANNIPGLENVANLHRLPAKGATVYAAPMLIKDGSGAPCRIFAQIGRGQDNKDPKSAAVIIRKNEFLFGSILSFVLLLSL